MDLIPKIRKELKALYVKQDEVNALIKAEDDDMEREKRDRDMGSDGEEYVHDPSKSRRRAAAITDLEKEDDVDRFLSSGLKDMEIPAVDDMDVTPSG